MSTFVLVHGAWLGGWAWRKVARDLRGRGHDVYSVTLTGLGERVHLGGPDVDLETHITDVFNVIEYEGLADVILAGHSYAGFVITGVADRAGDRLSHLVYVDSAPVEDGARMLDFFPPEFQERIQRQVEQHGDGWRLAFPTFDELGQDASLAGLGDDERGLMRSRATPQPFGTYVQPLRLSRRDAGDYERVMIACDDMRGPIAAGYDGLAALAAPPWHYYELQTGHWPMLSTPSALADLLDEVSATAPDRAGQPS
jgi:pimeloyl-ACP methyl ester carboxylesterase